MKDKKNRKKKKLKIIVIILFIILFSIIIFNQKIKNIYIFGNTILTDQEIIELAGLENYPKIFRISSTSIKNKIKISPYIENVKIKKSLFGKIVIEIKEYNFLLKDEFDNSIYISSLEKLPHDDEVIGIPSLINYVEEEILKEFLTKLNKIDKNVLIKISEIEYVPNEYDKDLFLFYMNDGNYVYITTKRLSNINKYEEILEKLDGKKGILYLDSGNHFEILQ